MDSPTSSVNKKNKFPNFDFVRKLNDSRFPVYQVFCHDTAQMYALKVFPLNGDLISSSFITESKLKRFSHPNIISHVHSQEKQIANMRGKESDISYILLEFASFGDFADILNTHHIYKDEILIRTFFHELLSGVEYLHTSKTAHMDLKLENLLLSDDLKLKIADFDLSYDHGDLAFRSKGTVNYRAPEIKSISCKSPEKADIYSCAIILFTLMAGGFPYVEDHPIDGHDLERLMNRECEEFWTLHTKYQQAHPIFDEDFKQLFLSMVCLNPEKRASIETIKKSKWFNGPVYTQSELVPALEKLGFDFGISDIKPE